MTEYNNGYTYQIFLTNQICEEMFPSAFFISHRLAKVFHIVLSLIGMSAITYFMLYCRKFLKFHINVKILFYFQFLACFLDSFSTMSVQTHHVITLTMAQEPCDVVISPLAYRIFSYTGNYTALCTNVSLIFMFIERVIASIFYRHYENTSNKIGIVFAVLSALGPIFIEYYVFYGVTFDYPQMNAFSSEPLNVHRTIIVAEVFLIIGIITSMVSIYLYSSNSRRIKSPTSRASLRLSSRYQIAENVTSARILWQLTFSQLFIYMVFAVTMSLIKTFVPKPRPAIWQVVTEVIYVPTIYCSVMPILCIFTIKNSEKMRNQKIDGLVKMSATGAEGWDNYQRMLRDQWA